MQMFKLYYNPWPITFVSRGTTWPQIFLQIFQYILKLREKALGKTLKLQHLFFGETLQYTMHIHQTHMIWMEDIKYIS